MKRLTALILCIMILAACVNCFAAGYTLPEKMQKQLMIGSGLKGSFTITAEGDAANQPFFKTVADAAYEIRGISSGQDLHYYVFQSGEGEQQTGLNEVYRKDDIYYFRSDMVPGKVLRLPTTEDLMNHLFPVKGENVSLLWALTQQLILPKAETEQQWKDGAAKYEKDLELWLADYANEMNVVTREGDTTAVEFSYRIPFSALKEKIVSLLTAVAEDPDSMALLNSIMSDEQKSVYFNKNLIYYYREALDHLKIDGNISIVKQVSTLGDVLVSQIELPMDQEQTGYSKLMIASENQQTFYEMSGEQEKRILILTENEKKQTSENRSYMFMLLPTEPEKADPLTVQALRLDISETADDAGTDEEKAHENHHYVLTLEKDLSHLPEGYPADKVYDFEKMTLEADLHYSSKYSQNAATTLEIQADWKQGNSVVTLKGSVKSSSPWVFQPFDVSSFVPFDLKDTKELLTYTTDWISNAYSMIHHTAMKTEEEASETQAPPAETEAPEAIPEAEDGNQ